MIRLHEEMEQERGRLNEPGQLLIEQSIPLSKHEHLLGLSLKVDQLMLQLSPCKSRTNRKTV